MLIAILTAAGKAANYVAGGKLLLEGTERATGVPVASAVKAFSRAAFDDVRGIVQGIGTSAGLAVEGFGDTAAGLLDPLHLFTDDPAAQRDAEKAAKVKARKAAKKAQAQAADAEARASQLEAQAADAEARAKTANDRAAAAEKAMKARAMKRFATTTRATLNRAGQAASGDQALALAQQALELAKAAQNPPTDARKVLASGAPDDVKALVADIIDTVNRDEEPDYERLVDGIQRRLDSPDAATREKAEDELVDLAMGVEGHDHDHAPGKSCGADCDCDPCKAASALSWEGADQAIEGDDPPVVIAPGSFEWDGAEDVPSISRRRRGGGECKTGLCPVR